MGKLGILEFVAYNCPDCLSDAFLGLFLLILPIDLAIQHREPCHEEINKAKSGGSSLTWS